jgi:N-acetylmuramoyl-L-alanine amidase
MRRAPALVLLVAFGVGAIFLFQCPMSWANPEMLGVRHWSAPSSTRVVIDLSDEITFNTFSLSEPPRIVIDLQDVRLRDNVQQIPIGDPLIDRVRLAQYDKDVVRLVLDVKDPQVRHHAFILPPTEDKPHRLVIDIEDPALGQHIQEQRRKVGKEKLGKVLVVVIDPGHGGEDPGAVGPNGTREKDIVLAIAKKLQAHVNGHKGVRAFLTRDDDYFLGLRQRVEVAQDYGADLFVSIHVDASRSRRVRGASVYCLSLSGATDEAARILAEKENASDRIGGVELNGDPNLNTILLDLIWTQTINESLRWGGMVLNALEKRHSIKFSSPRQAGFRVLKSPDFPSILVEVGFLTNPKEEKILRSESFQSTIAAALRDSIFRFLCQLERSEPRRMVADFCQDAPHQAYVVQPGENLSQIASRHHTSVKKLQALNNIEDASLIQPGQKIVIPSR